MATVLGWRMMQSDEANCIRFNLEIKLQSSCVPTVNINTALYWSRIDGLWERIYGMRDLELIAGPSVT